MQHIELDGVAMALPENAGTVEELLVGEQDPDAQLRVSQWQHIKRQDYKFNKSHWAALCNGCSEHNADPQAVGGAAPSMDRHLAGCQHVTAQVREEAAARVRAWSNKA